MLNLNCVICAELFGQTDDVHVTTCGHMFHFLCLTQWLERSKTCPQCRNKCNQRNIFRLYFNLANLDTSHVDIGSLQEQLDNTKLQLKLKEQEVQKAETQIKTLKESQKKCMKTICGLETKLVKKDFIINSYAEQVNILKADARNIEDLRKEVKTLRQRLETVEGVSSLLTSSNAEAENMLKTENDPKKLSVWLATLKRELVNCQAKKNDVHNVLRVLQNDLRREIAEKKQLEDRILQLESESYQLNEKLNALERPMPGTSKTTLNKSQTSSETALRNSLFNVVKDERRSTISPTIKENVRKIEESDSPYLNIKSSSVGFMPYGFKRLNTKDGFAPLTTTKLTTLKVSPSKESLLRKTSSDMTTEKYSILKKPRLLISTNAASSSTSKPSNLVFNGFGGSEKIDPFAREQFDDDDDVEIVDEKSVASSSNKSTLQRKNSSMNLLQKSGSSNTINLSNRLKSGGLRNFMISKQQKK